MRTKDILSILTICVTYGFTKYFEAGMGLIGKEVAFYMGMGEETFRMLLETTFWGLIFGSVVFAFLSGVMRTRFILILSLTICFVGHGLIPFAAHWGEVPLVVVKFLASFFTAGALISSLSTACEMASLIPERMREGYIMLTDAWWVLGGLTLLAVMSNAMEAARWERMFNVSWLGLILVGLCGVTLGEEKWYPYKASPQSLLSKGVTRKVEVGIRWAIGGAAHIVSFLWFPKLIVSFHLWASSVVASLIAIHVVGYFIAVITSADWFPFLTFGACVLLLGFVGNVYVAKILISLLLGLSTGWIWAHNILMTYREFRDWLPFGIGIGSAFMYLSVASLRLTGIWGQSASSPYWACVGALPFAVGIAILVGRTRAREGSHH